MQRIGQLNRDFGRARSVGNAIGTTLSVASVGIDTYENMQSHQGADGSVIGGDGFLTAAGKSILSNAIVNKVLTGNPVLAAAELLNFVALGSTDAGGITSPVTNMKGRDQHGCDWANSRELAIQRAEAGVYGENLKNAVAGTKIGQEAYNDPWKSWKTSAGSRMTTPFSRACSRRRAPCGATKTAALVTSVWPAKPPRR